MWGGDYVAIYKQALRYDMFKKMKFATTLAFGVAPHALGKDHPEGVVAGVHSNYHFTIPPGNRWPLNTTFVKKFHERWKEYPNFQAEGAYTTLYMLKTAIEKANKLVGGWPDDDAIIAMLEGSHDGAARPATSTSGRTTTRATRTRITGFSMNTPDYPFPVLDPGAHHHDPDPEHHGASRLAEGRADVDLHVDRQDLAAGGECIAEIPGPGGPCPPGPLPVGAPIRPDRPSEEPIHSAMRPSLRRAAFVATALAACALSLALPAHAGHELPFYPSLLSAGDHAQRSQPAAASPRRWPTGRSTPTSARIPSPAARLRPTSRGQSRSRRTWWSR